MTLQSVFYLRQLRLWKMKHSTYLGLLNGADQGAGTEMQEATTALLSVRYVVKLEARYLSKIRG